MSADGQHLFVAGADANALSLFSLHSGSLCFSESFQDGEDGVFGLRGAFSTAVSWDGRHVYVAARHDDALAVFTRDATQDEVAFLEIKKDGFGGVYGLHGASAVVVSPDDRHVMVASADDAAVVVLGRDASTDEMWMVDLDILPLSLYGASSIAVSPDGLNVYATASYSNALVVFSRNPADGTLGFLQEFADELGDITGFLGPAAVVVSPDGENVYVAAQDADALFVFERDNGSGMLTLVGFLQDGVQGVYGLAGISAIAVSSQGDRVFVASSVDNAVAAFRRTPGTGDLALLDVVDDVPGLGGASSLVVSEDGRFLYASGALDSAIVGFEVAACFGDEFTGDGDGDAICDDLDFCLGDDFWGDSDGDSYCDDLDLCPDYDDTIDSDGDFVPDGCDLCVGDDASGDEDMDGVCDSDDVCPGSSDYSDVDGDGIPDGCDLCIGSDALGDADGDGYCDDRDLCPGFDDTLDQDFDGVPDGCDLCKGDDTAGDGDNDGVCADLDCNDADPAWQSVDACGNCAGTTVCLFLSGFEGGDTSDWSRAIQ